MKKFTSFLKKAVIMSAIIAVGTGIGTMYFSTTTVKATVPEVVTIEAKAPILVSPKVLKWVHRGK